MDSSTQPTTSATLRYWTKGSKSVEPIVPLASTDPLRLSIINVMEWHLLSSMRTRYNLRLPKVRKALRALATLYPSPHALVDQQLETDNVDVFIRQHEKELLNLSRPNQFEFREVLDAYLQRIERTSSGAPCFFHLLKSEAGTSLR
jgi:hypothetical protein